MQTEVISGLERRIVGAIVRKLWLRDRRGGPWAPPAGLMSTPVAFEGNTGSRLEGTWFPAPRPRGAVVLAHPDRRYGQAWFWREGWVEWLVGEGFDVLTFDLTGYGRSVGPATYYHEDVVAAARFAQHWAGGFPVSVVGVSMGAFAAANASPRLDFVKALVLESPYPSFNAWYGRGAGRFAMDAFDLAFRRTGRALKAEHNISRAAPGRVLVAWSETDEVTPPHLSEAVARAAPAERVRTLVEKDAPHLGLLARSEAYRNAILHAIGGGDGW